MLPWQRFTDAGFKKYAFYVHTVSLNNPLNCFISFYMVSKPNFHLDLWLVNLFSYCQNSLTSRFDLEPILTAKQRVQISR